MKLIDFPPFLMSYLCTKIGSLKKIMKLIDFPHIVLNDAMQKTRDFDDKFVFEYCPRGYIEGGYY